MICFLNMKYITTENREAGTGWARPTLPFALGGPKVGREKKSPQKTYYFHNSRVRPQFKVFESKNA